MAKIETREFASEAELETRLIELSRNDQRAFCATVAPFSRVTTIHAFANPSRTPDHMIDVAVKFGSIEADRCIAYRGVMRGFTKAAVIREQNRGIGCE